MDSVTQATLGSSVGYAVWHKPLGRKSLLWGAGLGTLQDLDLILYPFLNDVQKLYWHRGESHSVFFTILGSFLIGCLLWRFIWKDQMSLARSVLGVFLIFSTHVLIDFFTIYGTQLLAPFFRHGYAVGNLFIIDPIFTLPLLFGCILAFCFKAPKAALANSIAIIMVCIYSIYTLFAHQHAHNILSKSAEKQGIIGLDSKTMATPFNSILWRHIIRTDDTFYVGYFSLLAENSKTIRFQKIPQNKELVEKYKKQANMQAVDWFSQGFWIAKKQNDQVLVSDIRFGELRTSIETPSEDWHYIFTWEINENSDHLIKTDTGFNDQKAALKLIWKLLTDS